VWRDQSRSGSTELLPLRHASAVRGSVLLSLHIGSVDWSSRISRQRHFSRLWPMDQVMVQPLGVSFCRVAPSAASPSPGVGQGCAAGARSHRDADSVFQFETHRRGLRTTRKSRAAFCRTHSARRNLVWRDRSPGLAGQSSSRSDTQTWCVARSC
jgi:hypothetical protein